jgi:uncharacterized membrane protein YgcG
LNPLLASRRAHRVLRPGRFRYGWSLACLLVLLGLAASATARSITLSRFAVEIQVLTDGDILVTETISPRFEGSWNGLERQIPVEYRTPQGFTYSVLLDPVSVTDERQQPLKYEVSRERHYKTFRIWIPGASDATRTVVLTYRVRNGLKYFADHDELYWNVTGDEWDMPIEQASARILLPAGATGVRAIAFTGAYGAREHDAEVKTAGPDITMTMRRPLGFREGLTAVVGWDKGLVREPGPAAQAWFFLRGNWPLAIPAVVFAGMFTQWYRRGRDPRRRPIAVAYEPPQDLTPAEVGTLLDNSPDLRDITATLVDLAVRGYLRIEEVSTGSILGLWEEKDYRLHLLKPSSEWGAIQAHERFLLDSLFAGVHEQTVALKDLEHRFYRHLPEMESKMFTRLLARRYYRRRPDEVRQRYVGLGFAGGIALTIGLLALSGALGLSEQTAVLAGGLSGLSVVLFGFIMPARTVLGTRVLEGILGFEEFLSRVEGPRLERMVKTPELFETYLPYAMALGVERNWARAFEGIYTTPPSWYQGGDATAFRTDHLVSRLSDMSGRTERMMASSPRSSGGSGFGGGGRSGGGFGGGGGRGF